MGKSDGVQILGDSIRGDDGVSWCWKRKHKDQDGTERKYGKFDRSRDTMLQNLLRVNSSSKVYLI